MQVEEKGVALLIGNQENTLLRFRALDFIVFNNKFFFEHLDSIKFLGGLCLGEHDFPEISFSKDSKEVKMIEADSSGALLLGRRFLNGSWSCCGWLWYHLRLR